MVEGTERSGLCWGLLPEFRAACHPKPDHGTDGGGGGYHAGAAEAKLKPGLEEVPTPGSPVELDPPPLGWGNREKT